MKKKKKKKKEYDKKLKRERQTTGENTAGIVLGGFLGVGGKRPLQNGKKPYTALEPRNFAIKGKRLPRPQ